MWEALFPECDAALLLLPCYRPGIDRASYPAVPPTVSALTKVVG
jgi:hypothetical protein